VIGTNKRDASETVEALLDDARAGRLERGDGELTVLLEERRVDYVEYAGWEEIDRHERARGESLGRPRVKLASWSELLARGRRQPD